MLDFEFIETVVGVPINKAARNIVVSKAGGTNSNHLLSIASIKNIRIISVDLIFILSLFFHDRDKANNVDS